MIKTYLQAGSPEVKIGDKIGQPFNEDTLKKSIIVDIHRGRLICRLLEDPDKVGFRWSGPYIKINN